MTRPGTWILLAALAAPVPARAQALPPIDTLALRGHTFFLSHDLLEGRETGSRGDEVAARYLAAAAERLGLAGGAAGGAWLQEVPVVEATVDAPATSLSLSDSSGTRTFGTPSWFLPNGGTAAALAGFGGELAWVVDASFVLSHPTALPPLAGRVAVMAGVFGADAMAADTLAARGATGVIEVVGDDDAYALYARSRGPTRMYLADSAAVSSFEPSLPAVVVRGALARAMLPRLDAPAQLERPFPMAGRRVAVVIRTRTRPLLAHNVVALLRGGDPARRGEIVAYTAHHDHLGIGEPDARGDTIYNGFTDNAAGCAALLAIAQALVARRPARSALFVFFTGEERGLLGSDWFVAHPPMPLAALAAVINLDAGAPPGRPVRWHVTGGDRTTLGAVATDVARAQGWAVETRPPSPNTDYFPFLRLGVPAVFLVPAPGAYEGLSLDSSNALRRRWDHYHEPADEWSADYPFAGLARYAEFALRLGLALSEGARPRLAR